MTRTRIAVAAIALAAVGLAWWLRFGTDDTYITFVYARAIVEGHGPTWFGAHVEGYANFLWMLWSALGLGLGANPLWWAWGASLCALAATIVIAYRIAALRTTPLAGLAAIGVCATSFTFLAFGTSGLETMLQTALLAAAWLEVERMRRTTPGIEQAVVLATYASLALWTRLDSAPVLAVLAAVAMHRLAKTGASIRTWVAGAMPVLVLVGGWFLWKLSFYGDLLPNTFYAKATSAAQGAWFVGQFLHAYLLWPLLVGVAVLAVAKRRIASPLPLAIVAAHVAYVIAVGGDFMEFRFFVPVLPPLAIALAEFATTAGPSPRLRTIALVVFTATFSLRHAVTFEGADDHSIDSVHELATFFGKVRNNDWSKLGRALHDTLGDTAASISCNGGAIPYGSGLPTIGYATYDDLKRRAVTLVVGSPTFVARGALAAHGERDREALQHWLDTLFGWAPAPSGTYEVYAAPIDDDFELLLWYLTPDPDVTPKIASWDHIRLHVD